MPPTQSGQPTDTGQRRRLKQLTVALSPVMYARLEAYAAQHHAPGQYSALKDGACRWHPASQQRELLTGRTRNHRRTDERQKSDVHRGIEIRVDRIATALAGEDRLLATILAIPVGEQDVRLSDDQS